MSSISALSGAPRPVGAGWYSDPTGGHQARWWDGEEWTGHVQALPLGEPPEDAWVQESRLVPSGSRWAVLSLRWGIVALVANILMAPTVLAFVFGVMALRRHSRLESLGYELGSRRPAVLGVVFGAVGILMAIGWIVALRLVTHATA